MLLYFTTPQSLIMGTRVVQKARTCMTNLAFRCQNYPYIFLSGSFLDTKVTIRVLTINMQLIYVHRPTSVLSWYIEATGPVREGAPVTCRCEPILDHERVPNLHVNNHASTQSWTRQSFEPRYINVRFKRSHKVRDVAQRTCVRTHRLVFHFPRTTPRGSP